LTPSGRMTGLGLSLIRAMNEGAPRDCVSLGLGEPSWNLPREAGEALSRWAALEAPCSYGPNTGLPELRRALCSLCGVSEEELLIASGSQGALFALFQAWAGPGDPVLLPDPGFLAYPTLARLAGARPVFYPLADDFTLDPGRFGEALASAPSAKLAVVNHPANPTGAGASREALDAVADACRRRGVILISDEVYRELYTADRPAGLLDSGPGAGRVALGSLSKAFGAPGLRVGWACGDPEVLAPARLVHNAMVSCVPRPSQIAAAALIEAADAVYPNARAELSLRWDAFRSAVDELLDWRPRVPAGGFYSWLPLPARGLEDPVSFCLRVRDEGRVIVVPGAAFGRHGEPYARVSWAGSPEDIREGVERLRPFWRG